MQTELNTFSVWISAIALLVSFLSFWESRKTRIQQGQAFLTIELIQNKNTIFVLMKNIGNTFAYNIKISVTEPYPNYFENLKSISPNTCYRYALINNLEIADYPEEIKFILEYNDIYSAIKTKKVYFGFNLINHLKYRVSYSRESGCYEIDKAF